MQKKKAAIYARFSSDMQREESIDAQVRACKEFATKEDYDVIEIYTDEAMTAKNDKRDDFQKMIGEALNTDRFDYILVHKFNRFARNKFDSVLYKKRLRDIGKNVISVTQKIDDTPDGKLLEGIIESMDEYYSANLALEVMKGMRENALKGRTTGGRPPLGYSYDENGFLTPNKQAFLVRKIFDMYNQGYGKLLIANELNAMGYRSQTGNEFRARTISDILSNEKYIGNYIYHLATETIRLNDFHKPIIDKVTWNKSKEVRQRKHKPRMNSKVIYSLTGKMICGVCGEKYSGGGNKAGSSNTGRINHYYVCSNKRYHNCDNKSVNKEKIETYLCEHILNDILNEERIEAIGNEFEKIAAEYEKQKDNDLSIVTLEQEKKELLFQRSRLMDLFMTSKKFSVAEIDEKVDKLDKHLKSIDKQLKKASYTKEGQITKKEAMKYLRNFKASFGITDKHIVKSLLDTFIDNIIIHKDNINITYKIDFSNYEYDESKKKRDKDGANDVKDASGANSGCARSSLLLEPIFIETTVTRKEIKRVKVNHN